MKKLCLLFLLLSGCSYGTYEGLSAEDWFNKYDSAEAKSSDLQSQIEDLQWEYDNLLSSHEDLKSCVDSALPSLPSISSNTDYEDIIDELLMTIEALTDISECVSDAE